MTADDEAPAATGASEEDSGEGSTKENTSAPNRLRVLSEFIGSIRRTGTLTANASIAKDVVASVADLVQTTAMTADSVGAKLLQAGGSKEEVEYFLQKVEYRLSGRAMTLKTAAEIMAMPDPDFVVEGLIEEGSFGVIYSESGLGKTFVILDICFCVAAGIPWCDRPVIQGPVVYVGAEGIGGLPKRLNALVEHHGSDASHDDFYVIDRAVDLLDPESVAEAIAAVEETEVKPVLLVFDTYARSMIGGDENSAKDAGMAVKAIDRLRFALKTAVIVVHHTNKAGQGERGSGALRGAADTMLELVQGGGDSGLLLLVTDKQKNFEEEDAIPLRLKPVGDSLVLVDAAPELIAVQWAMAKEPVKKEVSTKLRSLILAELEEADEASRTPITQTELLKEVPGNAAAKSRAIKELIEEEDSPIMMKESGKKKLYSLRR